VQKLLELLLNDNRAFLICDVLYYVCLLYRQYKNITKFAMISSHLLSEEDKKIIKHFLMQMTEQDIMYTTKIDKKLIAGIRLQSDTLLWEYSIRQRLAEAQLLLCPVRGI
ncbi:MAG: F0F1 ATP synthase subunit delta, partial [Candidatus Babeliales bacterium]